jgi:hypothetical protein
MAPALANEEGPALLLFVVVIVGALVFDLGFRGHVGRGWQRESACKSLAARLLFRIFTVWCLAIEGQKRRAGKSVN